mmetsp:Transcript_2748/g.10589  ORF Transcript_2748/g.10589 Transcript_2748/m.10589 type:complete len:223 (-) Transcript_2748:1019-1687(-)
MLPKLFVFFGNFLNKFCSFGVLSFCHEIIEIGFAQILHRVHFELFFVFVGVLKCLFVTLASNKEGYMIISIARLGHHNILLRENVIRRLHWIVLKTIICGKVFVIILDGELITRNFLPCFLIKDHEIWGWSTEVTLWVFFIVLVCITVLIAVRQNKKIVSMGCNTTNEEIHFKHVHDLEVLALLLCLWMRTFLHDNYLNFLSPCNDKLFVDRVIVGTVDRVV